MTPVMENILQQNGLDTTDKSFAAIIEQIYWNWDMQQLQQLMNDIMQAETNGEEVFYDKDKGNV